MTEIRIRFPSEKWADVFWDWYRYAAGDDGGFFDKLSQAGVRDRDAIESCWAQRAWLIEHFDRVESGDARHAV